MIEPSWRIAAESLIPSLANGLVGNGKRMQLSETQKALNIPSSLVYICGLAMGNLCESQEKYKEIVASPSFTKEQANFFQHLQGLYQKEMTTPLRVYQMSPTLLPSDVIRMIVVRDVKREKKEIAERAAKEERRLLAELPTLNKKDKTTRKPKTKTKKVIERENIINDSSKSPKDAESQMTSLLSSALNALKIDDVPNPLEDVSNSNEDDKEWREVKRKTTSRHRQDLQGGIKEDISKHLRTTSTPLRNKRKKNNASEPVTNQESFTNTAKGDIMKNDNNTNLASKTNAPSRCGLSIEVLKSNTVHGILQSSASELSSQRNGCSSLQKSTPIRPNVVETDNHDHENENNIQSAVIDEVLPLQNKIKILEMQLQKKDQELEMAHNSHFKALQTAEERWQERIQALQLRLYISETRLKVYEDALSQHVDSVRKNTAKGNGGNIAEEVVPTPLYSRIAKN
mmetsp:Transcript_8191/g.12577  ORF Transcript_8191/g.12577 Transcript_8191/m.12577 type:complete len:457 (-) Transcript_8191:165-1535(-)